METADPEAWKAVWQPVIDAIGAYLDDGTAEARPPADVIEASAVRRYLEPLEFDCALHYDRDTARAHGHEDIIAPYTAMSTFAVPPLWRPGRALFTSADRNARPAYVASRIAWPAYFPPYTATFATDVDIEFLRPARVGERLRRSSRRLLACEPKATKVGRGAFVKVESEITTEGGEVLARFQNGSYLYTPHTGDG